MQNVLHDELGRVITLTQDSTERIKGLECLYNNIETVSKVASLLSTSFGPNGLDKILISSDDDMVISNDGFTILNSMEMNENPISRLIVQLSKSQDEEVGDGTTGIVLIANGLLQECKELLGVGIHPVKLAESFEIVVQMVLDYYEKISEEIKIEELRDIMIKSAKTSLNSKIVSKKSDLFANMCTDAILEVCDLERRDVDFEMIKIETKIGKDISESKLIKGVVVDKEFSHPQMNKKIEDGRIALLTCPFEPPKMKTNHSVNITNVEEYTKLAEYEKEKFQEMIESIKQSGANVVVCQWGFDDEANHLLLKNDLPAIRWVGGQEMELIAVHTNAQIISRFEDLREEDLGHCSLEEVSEGTDDKKHIILKSKSDKSKAVTLILRGATDIVVEEAKRSVVDGLSAARNILSANKIIYGGGSSEISAANYLRSIANQSEHRKFLLAFAKALEIIPLILAQNSGYNPVETLSELCEEQIKTDNNFIGVGCGDKEKSNMKKLNVFDSLDSKRQQLMMATQLVTSILKIDDFITIGKK
ncbi:T-complex protein 1 epsilon subunit [Spraguea lophii 42_110]|uniref:T-complex protein 1 epsilon subunit n=1 Tax=Spraguea lophii (strain 42_110) TaxID=1358809 RepID=S7XVB3_SPRLO|nr:T-complex protein 1 epsilon subunit [Spraguea lophii 42_110]